MQLRRNDLLFRFGSFHLFCEGSYVVLRITLWVPGLQKLALRVAVGVRYREVKRPTSVDYVIEAILIALRLRKVQNGIN